jgi:hypothetical protein
VHLLSLNDIVERCQAAKNNAGDKLMKAKTLSILRCSYHADGRGCLLPDTGMYSTRKLLDTPVYRIVYSGRQFDGGYTYHGDGQPVDLLDSCPAPRVLSEWHSYCACIR